MSFFHVATLVITGGEVGEGDGYIRLCEELMFYVEGTSIAVSTADNTGIE